MKIITEVCVYWVSLYICVIRNFFFLNAGVASCSWNAVPWNP